MSPCDSLSRVHSKSCQREPGGSLGGGRLTGLGPAALATGAATFGFLAAGAVLWSLVVRITPTIWVTDDH